MNATQAAQNLELYAAYNQPFNMTRSPAEVKMFEGRTEGTLLLGARGNRIVSVSKSKYSVVRFFQAIGNFFCRISTDKARVDAVITQSKRVNSPNLTKVSDAASAVVTGICNKASKTWEAFKNDEKYVLPLA